METTLRRAAEVAAALSPLNPANVKLDRVKLAAGHPDTGSFRVTADVGGGVRVVVREVAVGGRVAKYAYALVAAGGEVLLRYDNAPHHPEVLTFPNHKHTQGNAIEPLNNTDLDGFVLEAAEILKEGRM